MKERYPKRTLLVGFVVGVTVVGVSVATVFAKDFPTARDVSKRSAVPTPREILTLNELKRAASGQASAAYPSDRVITPHMPIAVRQEHPEAPKYQEAISYTFLVHSMKFAAMCRMEDGRIALVSTGWLSDKTGEERAVFITYSNDEGQSWSQPREFHKGSERPQPISLDGDRLVLAPADDAGFLSFSNDGGKTWRDKAPFPTLPDGRVSYHKGTFLVEGETITGVFCTEGPRRGPVGWSAYSLLRRSRDGGRTWNDGIWLPPEWQTSEGAVTRAQDGALVVSLRTAQPKGYPSFSDHWRRITTARSADNGKTWTDHQIHFKYGKVHTDLVTLNNGNILLTYAVRMGELDGQIYHGVEAVLSRDHGKTWDWDNRFILFRWAMQQTMHSTSSLELSDGRILTLFLYHYDARWGKGSLGAPGYPLGITSVVIWSPALSL